MSLPLQVLSDCLACRVESGVLELVLPNQPAVGTCRLCGQASEGGVVRRAGTRFRTASEVVAALGVWAASEGEPPERFVAANFGAGNAEAVAAIVLAGGRVETSFDVVAWLFRTRTMGAMALGGAVAAEPGDEAGSESGSGGGGAAPPATPPTLAAPEARAARRERVADPLAVTRALTSTALADGRVEAAERAVLAQACTRLGAPQPTEEDWRAWRPNELGFPPDPEATVRAMIAVALADRVPDVGEARVIREFARSWRVPLPEPILPPTTLGQKAVAAWLGLFAR